LERVTREQLLERQLAYVRYLLAQVYRQCGRETKQERWWRACFMTLLQAAKKSHPKLKGSK